MKPSTLPGCVWRGKEGDGTSFHCFEPSIQKTVCPADCSACSLRLEPHLAVEAKPGIIEKVSHGIVGLTKAAMGMDHPGDEVVKQRWEICKGCEFFRLWQCTDCNCFVPGKIRVASEKCPKGFWNSVEIQK